MLRMRKFHKDSPLKSIVVFNNEEVTFDGLNQTIFKNHNNIKK